MNLTDRLWEAHGRIPVCNGDDAVAISMRSPVGLVPVLFANSFIEGDGDMWSCYSPHARMRVVHVVHCPVLCPGESFVIYPMPDAGLHFVCGIDSPSGLRVYVLDTIVLCVFEADFV